MGDTLIEIERGGHIHLYLLPLYRKARIEQVMDDMRSMAILEMERKNRWRRWFHRKPMTEDEAIETMRRARPKFFGNPWEEARAVIRCSGAKPDNDVDACLGALNNDARRVYLTADTYRYVERVLNRYKVEHEE